MNETSPHFTLNATLNVMSQQNIHFVITAEVVQVFITFWVFDIQTAFVVLQVHCSLNCEFTVPLVKTCK